MIPNLESLSPDLIREHQLQGLHYHQSQSSLWARDWKQEVVKNQLRMQELRKIDLLLASLRGPVVVLKGFALMGDVYEDLGARFASDIDLLVSSYNLPHMILILKKQGYERLKEEKWQGNDFKTIMTKKTDLIEITIEIHTRLFWHTRDENLRFRSSKNFEHLKVLGLEDQLIHLCGHLAFQHTFIKLFWLYDIQNFLHLYSQKIQWPLFWQKAQDLKLTESCQISLYLCNPDLVSQAPVSFKQRLLRFLCTADFLRHPRQRPWRYFLIKLLTKDQWETSLMYLIKRTLFKSGLKSQSA
jgi:hypothetical protein